MKYAYRARITCSAEQAETIRGECEVLISSSPAFTGEQYLSHSVIYEEDPLAGTPFHVCVEAVFNSTEDRQSFLSQIASAVSAYEGATVTNFGHNCYHDQTPALPCSSWESL